MSLPRPLKIIFKAATGAVALAAGTVVGVNIGNATLYADAPSPLDFATQNGADYSSKTKDYLREFKDVKVVVASHQNLDRFCKINFFVCGLDGSVTNHGNFAFAPSLLDKLWGLHPTVFLKKYEPSLMNQSLSYVAGKTSTVLSEHHSRMMFDLTLFHELGHHKSYRQRKPAEYFAMPIQKKELEADTTALPPMNAEHGPAGTDFVIHLRALTQADYDHDNLLPLKQPILEDIPANDSFTMHSHLSWTKYMSEIKSCTGQETRGGHMNGPVHDAFYRCVRNEKKAAPGTQISDTLLTERKKSYIAAYDYFYGPLHSSSPP